MDQLRILAVGRIDGKIVMMDIEKWGFNQSINAHGNETKGQPVNQMIQLHTSSTHMKDNIFASCGCDGKVMIW